MNSSPSGYFTMIEAPLNEIKAALQTFQNQADQTITDLSGGVGLVNSVFGRSGTVTAQTNDYTWAQIDKTTSSLADLATRSAADLSSGTLPDARFPATLPAISGANLTGVLKPADIGSTVQAWDADLDAIAAISATVGLLKKTAANTWSLDTSTYATQAYADALVVGLVDDRGNYDASGNVFPSSGGSGTAGAILKGDLWFISVAGTLGGVAVNVGDQLRALIDSPGSTAGNWAISEANIGYVPANIIRTLTAGAGLTGGGDLSADRTFTVGAGAGITVNADDVALTTPGTLTVLTTNSSSGNHTHAITASANPGAASSILATDSNGRLIVTRLTATDYLLIDNADANVFMKDTSTGWRVQTTGIITPQAFNSLRSVSYTAGLAGFSMNSTPGDAEFNSVTIRGELRAFVLKINELSATAGTHGVFYSASSLFADMTTPASISSGFTFDAKNSDAGGMLFAVGDRIRAKAFVSPSGTIIGDSWFTITTRTNHSTFTTYDATLQAGSTDTIFRAGTALADYGPAGTGFITLSADGTVGASPNLTMGTHAGSPWSSQTLLLRLGNLNGSYGYATDVYGFAAGDNSAAWVKIDPTNGIRLGFNSTTNVQIDASGNASFAGSVTATSGAIGGFNIGADYIRDAANSFGLASTVTGGDDVRFWAGDSFANRATAPFRVTEGGSVTMTSGSVGGWTINSTAIQNSGATVMLRGAGNLAFGATPPTSASAGTGLFLDSTGMYGLVSNVVQAKFDAATGAVTAGTGNVKLDVNGISINNAGQGGNNGLVFTDSGNPAARVLTAAGVVELRAQGASGVSAQVNLTALSSANAHSATVIGTASESASRVNIVDLAGTLGGLVVGGADQDEIPNAMLDVRGDGIITGLLKTGSTPVTLTNAAGKILSAAIIDQPTFKGTVTVDAPASGRALSVDGVAGDWAVQITGANFGARIAAGTNSASDFPLAVYRAGFASLLFTIAGNGGVVVGAPTGDNKGAGTINAQGVYDDNTLLSDWIFDLHYDGRARADDKFYGGQTLFSLDATRIATKSERRLPWMPTRETFEAKRGLGNMTTLLWQGQEQQQLYIFALEDRILKLEQQLKKQ